MKAKIISIGDELLIGQVIDTNTAWIARELNALGVLVEETLSIGDDKKRIIRSIQEGLKENDLLVLTGGLGPTHDDMTVDALSEYYQCERIFDEKTWENLQRMANRFKRPLTEAHRAQCYLPEKAELIHNKMGTAPGMWFEQDGKILVSVPGVPFEMQYLFRQGILQRLSEKLDGRVLLHKTILTVGEGESKLSEILKDFQLSLPEHMKMAFLPNINRVRIRLSMHSPDARKAKKELEQRTKQLVAIIPDLVFGYDEDSLEAAVGRLLSDRNLTLSTAESCTGGYLAHRITSISGSSRYFLGSVVSYANEVKMNVLGVKPGTLKQYGAVSEPTVQEMARGALELVGSDIAVSTSGIAGPSGGTPDKPVGTICLGIASKEKVHSQTIHLGKDRATNIEFTAIHALDMIRKFLTQQ